MPRFAARPVGTFGGDGRTDPDRVGNVVSIQGKDWVVAQVLTESYLLQAQTERGRSTLLVTPKEMEEHAG